MKLTVRPLTPDLWPAFADLFGKHGACNGCWCMYWRIGGAYNQRPREKNKAAFKAVVKKGPPPGLLAFEGDKVVGWAQLTPRAVLPHLDRGRFTRKLDDVPVWSLTCFFIRKGHRGKGVMTALLDAAIDYAKAMNAPALEAYPVKTDTKRSNSGMYTGAASSFTRAGFKTVAVPAPHRPLMRLELARKKKAA
jgi:GNAT superfamily N-acetyltransferase